MEWLFDLTEFGHFAANVRIGCLIAERQAS
jgi:hypothetical protein